MRTCTRRLEFDFGHRLVNHEAKCGHVHGHRAVVEIKCAAQSLDRAGRVIDFGEVKATVGGWVDAVLDHAFIANPHDRAMLEFLRVNNQRVFVMPEDKAEPSAENLAALLRERASELLAPRGIEVVAVRFYETPNGWADA